jgi:hypothetical protein
MANGSFYKEGWYACEFTGEQGFTKTPNENPQFFVAFQVRLAWDGTRWAPLVQQYIREFKRVVDANTRDDLMDDLSAMGFTGDSFRELDPRSQKPFIFHGSVEMVCNHKPDIDGTGVYEDWTPAGLASGIQDKLIDLAAVEALDVLCGNVFKGEKIGHSEAPATVALLHRDGSTLFGKFAIERWLPLHASTWRKSTKITKHGRDQLPLGTALGRAAPGRHRSTRGCRMAGEDCRNLQRLDGA